MTARPTVDRVIDAAIGRLEMLRHLLPDARHVLLAELHRTDGYPNGSDAPKVSHTAELTPTEAAASARAHLVATIQGLDDELNAGRLTLDNLDRECRRIIGHKPATPRCDGGINLPGYLEPVDTGGWSTPDCHNIPDPDRTVCARCRQAAARWKRQHDMSAA